MAEAEKRKRITAKGKFTRQEKLLTELLDNSAPEAIVTPQYEKFVQCWNSLEDAHDSYMEIADFDIEADNEGLKYLEDPSTRYRALVKRYSEFLKTSGDADRDEQKKAVDDVRAAEETSRKQMEAEKKLADEELRKQQVESNFKSTKAELESSIDSFNRLAIGLKESVISSANSVKQQELDKVNSEFTMLKGLLAKLAGVDQSQDISEVQKKFVDNAETVYLEFHKAVVKDMKDIPTSRGTTSTSDNTTKKEVVKLPEFVGDEKSSPSPFLTFPVWLKQWNSMIVDYSEKYRDRMLCDHLDSDARSKFIGFESDYKEAMDRLEKYYGDTSKVVKCVMNQVKDPDSIVDEDYRGLVRYSSLLEHNFNRLTSMNLQHEMSNTSVMSVIVRKFPRAIEERWHDHLLDKKEEDRAQPFPVFIKWLSREKQKWTCMISSETEVVEECQYNDLKDDRKCFGCGEKGHIGRDCPKTKSKKVPQQRKKPDVKKYWCALHKDDKSRRCFSDSCRELRKMKDVAQRVSLLKENKDCTHCCGDHKPEDCSKKDRVCGGGKSDRGCSQNHKLHELFCPASKVCMMVLHAKSVGDDNHREEGVVLCIMRVRAPKGRDATVF